SLYNAEYRNALLQGIIKLEAAKRGLSPAQLDLLIFEKSAERRNDILGSLAEASLRAGLSSLCRYAAGRGRRLSHEGSVPWTRASLYHASCSVTEGGASAVASLKSLSAELLDHEDKELLRSALLLAEHAAFAGKSTAVTTSQLSAKEALTEDQAAFRDKLRDDLASVNQVMEGSKE
ncbi:MAG: hypothetical protein ACKVP5_09910, partial [Aestuariivirga sp.]